MTPQPYPAAPPTAILVCEALLPFALMALIFLMSGRPVPFSLPINLYHIDKFIHFGVFGLLAFSICQPTFRWTRSLFWAVLLAVLVGSLYGVSDEIHQSYVPGRHDDLGDILADIAGSVGGALVWLAWIKKRPIS